MIKISINWRHLERDEVGVNGEAGLFGGRVGMFGSGASRQQSHS